MFKFDNKNPKKRCEICSKLTIKTTEQRKWLQWRLVFLLLTLIYFTLFSSFSIGDSEQVKASWILDFKVLLSYQVINQLPIKIRLHKEQRQQWKHEINIWKIMVVNFKYTKTTTIRSFLIQSLQLSNNPKSWRTLEREMGYPSKENLIWI